MNKKVLIARNRKFAHLINELPNSIALNAYSRQLIRCSSSVGANYRAACRAKSDADFIYKLKIVEEEADESINFLDLINELSKRQYDSKINGLIKEVDELLAIYVASIKTVKNRVNSQKMKNRK